MVLIPICKSVCTFDFHKKNCFDREEEVGAVFFQWAEDAIPPRTLRMIQSLREQTCELSSELKKSRRLVNCLKIALIASWVLFLSKWLDT